jgi:hypothetical protein
MLKLCASGVVVGLVMVFGRNTIGVVIMRRAVRISERQGWCLCICLIVSYQLLVVVLLCPGVSFCSFFLLFFLSHPLLLVC